MENVKILFLLNNQILISQIEEVGADIGEPDCKLIEPFLLDDKSETLSPWLVNVTNQNTFMINSDKVLSIFDPKPTLLEKYQNLIK
jgi:hypothetical protein